MPSTNQKWQHERQRGELKMKAELIEYWVANDYCHVNRVARHFDVKLHIAVTAINEYFKKPKYPMLLQSKINVKNYRYEDQCR